LRFGAAELTNEHKYGIGNIDRLCKEYAMPDFDLKEYPDIIETINFIIRGGGIAEIKVERRTTPTVVEIKRVKRYPPKD